MYSAYGEFLSLAHIDSMVDGIYKAYLDTVLINLKIDHRPYPTYWEAVKDFRRSNLDPFTPKNSGGMLDDSVRLSIQKDLDDDQQKRERFSQADDYLYWFDLRAKFWAETVVDDKIKAMLASAADLKKLKDAAKELQSQRAQALKQKAKQDPPLPEFHLQRAPSNGASQLLESIGDPSKVAVLAAAERAAAEKAAAEKAAAEKAAAEKAGAQKP